MPVNSFKCPICGRRTIHDEVSYAEHQAIRNCEAYIGDYEIPRGMQTFMNNIISHSPFSAATKFLTSFNGFWKCRECGWSYARKKNGEIDYTNY